MQTFIYHENPSGKNRFRQSTDAYAIDEELQIYAVADAPLRALTRQHKRYPQDDLSALASQVFCNTFVDSARKIISKNSNFNEDSFKRCLQNANKAIKDLNIKLGRKYNIPTEYDVAETVGMGSVVFNGILYYGGLEDSYVNLLRGDELKDIHKFDYQIMKSAKYMESINEDGTLVEHIDPELLKLLPKEYYWEALWCTYLRNNTDIKDEYKNQIGWGCFTGEESAMEFAQIYSTEIQIGDHLLLYTDGMISTINNIDLMKWFVEHVRNSFEFQKEFAKRMFKENHKTNVEISEKLLLYIKL